MAELRDLLPLVLEKCSGMPNQSAIDQLKKAYRNFCLESGFVQQTETVDVDPVTGSVILYPEADHYIHSINVVKDMNGKRLELGVSYKADASNNVTIVQGHSKVVITYSIVPEMPIDDGVDVNADVLRRWPDEIAAGAASLLRLMPHQPWTNVALSDFYQRDFVKGHREAYRIRVVSNDEDQFQTQSKRDFF